MKYLIFDFNGTLVDDLPLAVELLNNWLKPRGIDLYSYPLDSLRQMGVKKFLSQTKISKIEFLLAYKDIKNNIRAKQTDCPPVTGITQVLKKLSQSYSLLIYSSNHRDLIEKYLHKYNLNQYFHGIYEDNSYFGKHVGLKKIIHQLNINPQEAAYIGDESRDIYAAKKIGLKSIAVTWGFEGDQILFATRPDYLLTTPNQLLNL